MSRGAGYRKRRGTDTWHFCKDCSNSPTTNYEPSSPSHQAESSATSASLKRKQATARE
jgi:hypothetical protein